MKKTNPFNAAVESCPNNRNRPASQPARMIAKMGMEKSIRACIKVRYKRWPRFVEPKACGKLWRTEFYKSNNLQFDTGYFEDVSMVFYAVSIAGRINNHILPGYHYVVRDDSITGQKPTRKHIDDYMAALTRMQQLFTRRELIKPQSSMTASYALFLINLCIYCVCSRCCICFLCSQD